MPAVSNHGDRRKLYMDESGWRRLERGQKCSWDGQELRCRNRAKN